MSEKNSISVAFEKHNHDVCLTNAMQTAEEYCHKQKLQLTPVRRKVLELLLQEHRALGALSLIHI